MGGGLNALGWMLGVVLSVTDFVNNFIGYAILVLMVPVSIWTFLPWIRRIRIGLAPLDAEASQTDSQNASNREAFAIALGVLRKEGQELAKDYELENKPCNQWIARVTDLIGAALGEEEAITFKSDGMLPGEVRRFRVTDTVGPQQNSIMRRLRRVDKFVQDIDSLNLRPDFDAQSWIY